MSAAFHYRGLKQQTILGDSILQLGVNEECAA